jgi:PAS domain S-box-containing protein
MNNDNEKNTPEQNMTYEELEKQYNRLLRKHGKLEERFDKIISQGDRQQLYVKELNDQLAGYIVTIDEHIITISTDIHGKITSVSTAFKNNFGYKSSEIEGKEVTYLVDSEDYESMKAYLDEVINNGQPLKKEIRLQKKNEATAWVEIYIRPVMDGEEITGITIIGEDVTDKKAVKNLMMKNLSDRKYDPSLLDFMASISSATLQKISRKINAMMWLFLFAVVFFIGWSYVSTIDEVVKSDGRITSLVSLQTVQSPEKGILHKTYVQEGDQIEAGEKLASIRMPDLEQEQERLKLKLLANKAKISRLEAEAKSKPIVENSEVIKNRPEFMKNEVNIYKSNKKHKLCQLDSRTQILYTIFYYIVYYRHSKQVFSLLLINRTTEDYCWDILFHQICDKLCIFTIRQHKVCNCDKDISSRLYHSFCLLQTGCYIWTQLVPFKRSAQ